MDDHGEGAEFSDYVAARWGRLVRSAVLLGCSPPEAEDIVQSALTRCLLNWSKVRRADDRDAYVHRVLMNTLTSARRRRWTKEIPVSELPEFDHDDDTAQYDDLDALSRSLRRLSPEHRTAVVLRFYAHLSEQQMAAVLEIAPGTVKSRLSRALHLLAADPDLSDLRGTP